MGGGELRTVVAVALGGIIGSTARWGVGTQFEVGSTDSIPWHTLTVNVVGCLLIGVVSRRLDREATAWAFTATGLLGGFTTMSAFAVELNDLADAGHNGLVITYSLITLAGGLGAFLIGERAGPGSDAASADGR